MIFSKPSEKKTVKARSKPSEYEAMLRNGFILPKLNSTIVNKNYMFRVKSGQEYCPLASDIKVYKICINPPGKYFLLNEIQQELKTQGDVRDLSYDEKHLPDVEWCVKALLALNPGHRIFNKDYVPGANEKARKGQKNEQIPVDEEEELPTFPDFESGLPTHLHLQHYAHCAGTGTRNLHFNSQILQNEKASQMKMEDDTITEKEDISLIRDHLFQEENQMDILEPVNPFCKGGTQERILSNPKPDLQFSRESGFEILGQIQSKSLNTLNKNSQMSKTTVQKPIDLQSTLKQLNNSLFPINSNVSKNKSKKSLTSQEEELIVKMFEKLVVNCKGRPVDFVKSYLDQYHSDKSVYSITVKESTATGSKNFMQNGSGSQFNFAASSQSKKINQASPSKQKLFDFGQTSTQASSFNVGNQPDENFQSQTHSQTGIQLTNNQSRVSGCGSQKLHLEEDVKMKIHYTRSDIQHSDTYAGQSLIANEFSAQSNQLLNFQHQYEPSQTVNAYGFEKQGHESFEDHCQQTRGYPQSESVEYASANEQQTYNPNQVQQVHDKMQFII